MIPSGAAGPFLGSSPFADDAVAADVAQVDGVTGAAPQVFSGTTVQQGDTPKNVNVFGAPADGPGDARGVDRRGAEDGRRDHGLEQHARKDVGDSIEIGSSTLEVVGVVNDSTALAGTPNVFLTIEGARSRDVRRATAASRRSAGREPDRCAGRLPDRRPGRRGRRHPPATRQSSYGAITFMAVLLWIVAALIVGSVIYLSALERVRDFAVFKAVGVSTRSVLGGLALQAVIVAVVAALVGARAVVRASRRRSR